MEQKQSLDALERLVYAPAPHPFAQAAEPLTLTKGQYPYAPDTPVSLDGAWEMIEGGGAERVLSEWTMPIAAQVPGSVHADLLRAGVIPDPTIGKNDLYAREQSYKTWWYRKRFSIGAGYEQATLHFGGVCHRCDVFLNGYFLGSHTGMFGGPDFDVSGLLLPDSENTLMVRLYPAPNDSPDFRDINQPNHAWKETVVFNCNYGWHYANMPALGIWRSVSIQKKPAVAMEKPFIATQTLDGDLSMAVRLDGGTLPISGRLEVTVSPLNFEGAAYRFAYEVQQPSTKAELHLQFQLPNPQIWYPLEQGAHPLYQLEAGFYPNEGQPAYQRTTFGIRTIEMKPLPGGERPDTYNWTLYVNGKPLFIKGANWCTLDSLMRLPRETYERFLSMAAAQHTNFLRAWGSGMIETDDFYDLCDQSGILVMQEWPTAWDSQQMQPPDVLRDTAQSNVVRLRNHPSLALWCGANEAFHPTDAIMNMLGRITYELDGTRVFHRSDPWGGSTHNYNVYWENYPLDFNLHYTGAFIGEFGLASSPNLSSVRRYLNPQALEQWPPPDDGEFAHHTPKFNTYHDMEHLTHYAALFGENDTAETFILCTQLAQITGIRHTLELARTRSPEATGVCYYKLTDVYPACAWSVIDYYGAPKLSYYAIQDAYAPVCATVLLDSLQLSGDTDTHLPVYWLNDLPALPKGAYQMHVSAYDDSLCLLAEQTYAEFQTNAAVCQAGEFVIPRAAARSLPVLVTADVVCDGKLLHRNFYWLNFAQSPGCLFRLPQTTLRCAADDGQAQLTNAGEKPAVGVTAVFADDAHAEISDNLLFLLPGETVTLSYQGELNGFGAWNAAFSAILENPSNKEA